jgi:hypothetical protein
MKSKDKRFVYLDRRYKEVPKGSPAENVSHIGFNCRSVPGEICHAAVRGRGMDGQRPTWTWDGNFDAPTLAPSINCQHDKCGMVSSKKASS